MEEQEVTKEEKSIRKDQQVSGMPHSGRFCDEMGLKTSYRGTNMAKSREPQRI